MLSGGSCLQIIKNTLVQTPLELPTLPELLVVVIQALPVLSKLVYAALVDVFDYGSSATRDFPALFQAFDLAFAVGLIFTHHEVVIVRFAASANEIACGEQRCRRGTNLVDLGNVVGERIRIDEDVLVEAIWEISWRSYVSWL